MRLICVLVVSLAISTTSETNRSKRALAQDSRNEFEIFHLDDISFVVVFFVGTFVERRFDAAGRCAAATVVILLRIQTRSHGCEFANDCVAFWRGRFPHKDYSDCVMGHRGMNWRRTVVQDPIAIVPIVIYVVSTPRWGLVFVGVVQ